jgi:hypothetical protein
MIGIACNDRNYKQYVFAFVFWFILAMSLIFFLPQPYKIWGLIVLVTTILHTTLLDYYYMSKYPPNGDPQTLENNDIAF